MYKNITSKENYKFKRSLKYLKLCKISKEEKKLIDALDNEVKNSTNIIANKPGLIKSGTTDRNP